MADFLCLPLLRKAVFTAEIAARSHCQWCPPLALSGFYYVAFDVAFGGKAHMSLCAAHDCFWPKAYLGSFRTLGRRGTMAGGVPRARRIGADMRRREFLSVLTGAVAISSRVAPAQQSNEMRRIGILVPSNSTDMKFQIQVQAFEQELKKF